MIYKMTIHLNSVMPRTARQASAVTPHKTLALKRCSLYFEIQFWCPYLHKANKHTNKILKWQNLVKIVDKVKQHYSVDKEGFFCYFWNVVSALMEGRVDKANKLCIKSAFSKGRFPLTVYWSRCYGALQNSYNYP